MNDDIVIKYNSSGGFIDTHIEVIVLHENPKHVKVMIDKSNNHIVKEYAISDPVGKLAYSIIKSGVYSLKPQKESRSIAGADLPRVRMELNSAGVARVVERDYNNRREFEPAFHRAQSLFYDIVRTVYDDK